MIRKIFFALILLWVAVPVQLFADLFGDSETQVIHVDPNSIIAPVRKFSAFGAFQYNHDQMDILAGGLKMAFPPQTEEYIAGGTLYEEARADYDIFLKTVSEFIVDDGSLVKPLSDLGMKAQKSAESAYRFEKFMHEKTDGHLKDDDNIKTHTLLRAEELIAGAEGFREFCRTKRDQIRQMVVEWVLRMGWRPWAEAGKW